jgi:uncharacterized protein DUF2726
MSYLLLLLLPLGAVAYIVRDHRRKAADREAASAERLQQMLGTVRQATTADDVDSSAESAVRDAPETTPPSTAYVRRERVLDRPQTLLYYLLRTALPDCVVLAQVPLSLALEVNASLSPYAREEALRKLAPRTIDFLVCERSMKPIAAVQLIVATNAGAAAEDSLQSLLTAVGVRFIELDGTALPRKDAIREIVLGEDAPAARSETELEAPAT